MSIEELLKSHTDAVIANTEATNRNSDLVERAIAGQEAAIAKFEASGGAAPKRTRGSKASDAAPETGSPAAGDTGAGAEQPAKVDVPFMLAASNAALTTNAKGEAVPAGEYRAADFSGQEVKNEFLGWLGETEDADVRKQRTAFVPALGSHFGVKQLFSPTDGLQNDEQRKQALFYLRRKRAGLTVDFGADYDFDGDPQQGVAESAPEDDGTGGLG